MEMKIYNTLSGEKDPFERPEGSRVTMYVCGVTVYDVCHVGHARALVVFDMIHRYLKHRGYNVICVRNFTDVDDKIIKRANEEGTTCEEIASRYIRKFREDVGELGLLKPAFEPKATEHIQDMIDIVSALIEKGHAYEVDGDVFFAVSSFGGYGKLSNRTLEEMRAGARVEVDERKKNPLDFALWKRSKPGEPSWDSPWGKGRPGWHVECSAMSIKLLGETIDIHGGGQDLIFPHHENEIAQSECYTGKQFARCWIHNGHVMMRDEKMSKSLGNFFTLKQIYKEYEPRVLHFFLVSRHYRSPLNFSKEGLSEAREALKRIDNCLAIAEYELEKKGWPPPHKGYLAPPLMDEFESAMCNDFNTRWAVAIIFVMVVDIHNKITAGGISSSLRRMYEDLKSMCDILGIRYDPPQLRAVSVKGGEKVDRDRVRILMEKERLTDDEINELIRYRYGLRKMKKYEEADEIRSFLKTRGDILRDDLEGTTWIRE